MATSHTQTAENHPPTVLKVTRKMLGMSTFASQFIIPASTDRPNKSKDVVEQSRSYSVTTTKKKSQPINALVAPYLLAQLKEAQAKGVRLLDKENPSWWRKVKITKLDMCIFHKCVLGQVYDGYTDGLRALHITSGAAYGFDIKMYAFNGTSYTVLGELWKDAIRRRRARKSNTNRTRSRRNK